VDRNLALETVRVTESAALASARLVGRGDEKAAAQAAAGAMRAALEGLALRGTVVLGDGEKDEGPTFCVGEEVGSGAGPEVDVALEPLEGATICANGGPNALSVIALAEPGKFLRCPNVYMEKIAVGPKGRGVIDLDKSPTENLKALAKAKGQPVEDLTVVILYRPRHEALIQEVRSAGARIKLISDGDVEAAMATANPETGIDILMGIGGAPQGILAAAALRCMGGDMQGRLRPRNHEEAERAGVLGMGDAARKYSVEELAGGDVMFAATGVTGGNCLQGVRFFPGGASTHSVVMRSKTGTVRVINTTYRFDSRALR